MFFLIEIEKKSYRNFHFVFYFFHFIVEETFEDGLQNRAEKDEKEESISGSGKKERNIK